VAENLRLFIDSGLATLTRVVPAFAGLISQPKVLKRFHAMVGGDAAFAGEAATGGGKEAAGEAGAQGGKAAAGGETVDAAGHDGDGLATYLSAEQRAGRIDEAADIDAAVTLVVGAIHGQILPRVLFSPPGSPVTAPPELPGRLAATVLSGIAPGSPRP
jgi:hypothetical protein